MSGFYSTRFRDNNRLRRFASNLPLYIPPSGGGSDPYWANVVSLLHFDGADGSTVFTDQTGKVWTAAGNAQIDTAQSKFGGSSLLLDGSGDYLTCNDADFSSFGTSTAWTLEAWVRLSALTGNQAVFAMGDSSTNYFQCTIDAASGLRINTFGADILNQGGATGLSAGTWMHVAFVRNGANLYGFVDGVLRASSANGASMPTITSQSMFVGANNAPAGFLNGHVDEVRATKGQAVYTADFTPPTAAFPNS